jgi:hypothetical protein
VSHFKDHLSVMEAISLGYRQQEIEPVRGTKNWSEFVDTTVCYCPSCDSCFEIEKIATKWRQLTYEDFPTIGKTRKRCALCRYSDGEKTFMTKPGKSKSSELTWNYFHFNKQKRRQNA